MAVISVDRMDDPVAEQDEEGHFTATVVYQVRTDSDNDGPMTALLAPGVPNWGDSYAFGNESDPDMFCRRVGPAKLKDPNKRSVWLVPVVFSTKRNGKKAPAKNPLDEPWEIAGDYSRLSRFTMIDKDGAMITNSAFEPKIVQVPHGHDTIHLSGNTATLDHAIRRAAILKTNSVAIWGYPPRTLLLTVWRYHCPWHGNTQYVHHGIDFEVNDDGWNEIFIDMGTRRYAGIAVGFGTPVFNNRDDEGHLITSEVPLDGTGELLDVTATPQGVSITKQVIREYDFHNLGFPDPLPGPFV